jgi:hypothetical protein
MGCYPHFILPMRRSRGFASTAPDCVALFGLAFASAAPQNGLTWPGTVSRRIIMQKARHHPSADPRRGRPRRALTACRHVVSGSVSSPDRGSSHLSLALLGSLSVAREYLALRDGPRGFRPPSTWTALLRCQTGGCRTSPTGLSPAVADLSRCVRLNGTLVTPMRLVLQPRRDESRRFGLLRVRSPLLTESRLLSFPGGTEMFQFPPLAACAYGFSARRFGDPGISARLTAPPGLSQSSTPFVASWRQDIPHMPLGAWPH